MRNATLPLSDTDMHAAHVALDALVSFDGTPVRFNATKRTDGSVSTRTGTVIDYCGDDMMSNASVRVDTPDGERTFNLYLIENVEAI